MKYTKLIALMALVGAVSSFKLIQKAHDEVDDLLAKQDEKDAQEIAQKEFNDAGSKMN